MIKAKAQEKKGQGKGAGLGKIDMEIDEAVKSILNPAPYTEAELFSRLTAESNTDKGNANCLLILYPNKFAYSESNGWLIYNGRYWERSGEGLEIDQAIMEHMLPERIKAHIRANGTDGGIPPRLLTNTANKNTCKDALKAMVEVKIKDFDTDPDALNCYNGVVNLKTKETLPHDSVQRFTYCIPVEYDKDADQKDWVEWLSETVSRGEGKEQETAALVDWMKKAGGYTITGHTREEILFYLFGPSRSGKGTFTEVMLAVMGRPLSDELPFSTFTRTETGDNQHFDLAPLKPCRFVAASESNSYERFNDAKVKHLTGGNLVRCAFKHKAHFSYRPQFKIWLSSNSEVNADPDDNAVWGRIRVIDFPHSHLGTENKLMKSDMMKPEYLRGVLAWLVEGANEWYSMGKEGLKELPTMTQAKEGQRERKDNVAAFLSEESNNYDDETETIVPDGVTVTPSSTVYIRYKTWCTNNGITPKQQGGLTEALKHKGFTTKRERVTVDSKSGKRTMLRCIVGLSLTGGE